MSDQALYNIDYDILPECIDGREALESVAKQVVSSELFYDLCDTIDDCSDYELRELIRCGGDYRKEMKLSKRLQQEAIK